MNWLSLTAKRLFIPSVCLVVLLLAGCWDRKEVNDLAIIIGIGLHKTDDDQLELSYQLVNPAAMGGGQQGSDQPTTVEKNKGKTAYDANSKMQQKLSRRLFSGHSLVIFISEEMAKKGIRKHIDFLARHPNPRMRSFIFITKGNPADFFKVSPDLEKSSSEVARELANLKVGMSVNAKELLQMSAGLGQNVALPLLEIEEEPPNTVGLIINGTAVFQNGKMVGQLDSKVTRGVLWLINEVNSAAVTIKPENTDGHISFNIKSSSELIPKIKNGKWTITVKINSIDDVVENQTRLNLMNPDIVKKLEKQLEAKIDKRIRTALEHVQKDMQADILGFGQVFHRNYPEQWAKVKHKWKEKFPEVRVTIKSDVKIKRPGRSTSPPGMPEDRETGQ
ncbi:Ger(x)C family spore germination protein [Virgibacillus sp. L01]|uniref:Ger(x)C family spore germination protein n=1 Tax=Virgibacillus sp. L01 TaxID=3457429 RepID=UPI003FD2D1DB